MKEKKFENSFIIEGNYNSNYLVNLFFLAKNCLTQIYLKKGVDYKKNKKLFKNIKNLLNFLDSSIDVFNRLSIQDNDERCVIHNIEYTENIDKKK